MLRRRAAEHRGLDRFLRAEGVPLRVRLVCHVHAAVSRLASTLASTGVEGDGRRRVRSARGHGDDGGVRGQEMTRERRR
jgi:hypothetical protein